MKAALGEEVDDLAEPEHRHGYADQAEPGHGPVDAPPAPGGGDKADGEPGRHPQHRGAGGQGERDRGRAEDGGHHELAAVDEARQVAGDEQAAHEGGVLGGKLAVQTVFVADGFERLGGGAAAGEAGGRVGAGGGEENQEHEHADAEEHQERPSHPKHDFPAATPRPAR